MGHVLGEFYRQSVGKPLQEIQICGKQWRIL